MSNSTCKFRHMNPTTSISPQAPRLLLAAVMSGLLLAMLDQTIVGTALPTIVRDARRLRPLRVGRHRVPRAGDRLAADLRAALGPPRPARAAADRHGALPARLGAVGARRRTWTQLIGWRALQGLGAGALEGLSFILVADLFAGPPQRRAAGRARRADGRQLHRRPAGRRLPHRPRRLALRCSSSTCRSGSPRSRSSRACCPRSIGRSERGARRSTCAGIALLTVARRAAARRPQRARRAWTSWRLTRAPAA